ncbi:hypothetical protein CGRA01v4_09533 [Colletotrichum graminicola]|nr:hypothetical protein CGRA01v4_09533 [Colletotrichum graminicola]
MPGRLLVPLLLVNVCFLLIYYFLTLEGGPGPVCRCCG